MRYSAKAKFRKCVKGYNFLSFARKFGGKYGTKLMDTATQTGIDARKVLLKELFKKLQNQ